MRGRSSRWYLPQQSWWNYKLLLGASCNGKGSDYYLRKGGRFSLFALRSVRLTEQHPHAATGEEGMQQDARREQEKALGKGPLSSQVLSLRFMSPVDSDISCGRGSSLMYQHTGYCCQMNAV